MQKVQYDTSDSIRFIDKMVEEYIYLCLEGAEDPEFGSLSNFFARRAGLKHPAFREEKEWRIIQDEAWEDIERSVPSFRQGPQGLTPYKIIRFDYGNLREIVVGPHPNQGLQRVAVRRLLRDSGFDHVSVRLSEAPFR